MKTVKNSKIRFSRTIVLIIILLISFLLTNYDQKNIKNTPLFVSALIPHSAISITDDSGFSGFPGLGTAEDPYLIDGYNITTTSSIGIEISGTTKYFVIKNCYVNALDYGIYINNIADGTAIIRNNNCTNNNNAGILLYSSSNNNSLSENNCSYNNGDGIYLSSSSNNSLSANNCSYNNNYGILLGSSSNNSLSANNCSYNNNYGIYLYSSSNNSLSANNCSYNNYYGICLYSSSNNSLSENNCTNNYFGISLYSSSNNSLSANNCTNNNYGIYLDSSSNNSLSENNCSYNNDDGIYLSSSSSSTVANNTCNSNNGHGISLQISAFCVLSYNLLQENDEYGIYLNSYSNNNRIHHNAFINNSIIHGIPQAYDCGSNNVWYDVNANEGNYWSDWSGTGNYFIDGTAGTQDCYPLDESPVSFPDISPPTITDIIHSPSTPTELDTVTINATVTDASGVQSVILHYRVNSGTWQTISMTLISGNLYSVTIGSFAVSDTIEYYITAIDDSINHNEATEDNGGLYYVLTVGSSDVTGPVITSIAYSPSSPTELDSISINATVTDTSGVQSVTLHYRVNGGAWIEVSMTLVSSDLYSATIGSFASSDTIEYYITAIDDSLNHNEATEDNEGAFYNIIVGSSDTSGPSITGVVHSPSSPTELDSITINTTVTDSSGVQSVTLHYRINGGAWQTIAMTLVSGDIYSVTIGSFAVSDIIEYYISAIDDSINHNEATEDNGGLYYVLTVDSSDVTSPAINDIVHSPSSPTDLDTITINTTVTDDSGLQSVTLHYRINGGTWQTIGMTLSSGNLYSVTIGSFTIGDTIEYYITAIDDSINHNEATDDNEGSFYNVVIGSSDVTSPAIVDIIHSPSSPTDLDTITINATVTDSSGVQSVNLNYRINGGTWQTISMTLISGDFYSVTIGTFTIGDTIEYYITAVDNSINHNEATEDNSGLYYSFTVTESIPEFQMFSLLLPAITLLFLGLGLMVLQRRKK